jgi:predicted Fe-S protein YdhL (DUF1289 family)
MTSLIKIMTSLTIYFKIEIQKAHFHFLSRAETKSAAPSRKHCCSAYAEIGRGCGRGVVSATVEHLAWASGGANTRLKCALVFRFVMSDCQRDPRRRLSGD